MEPTLDTTIISSSPEETARIAWLLGAQMAAGDVILLQGPVGAGKSHFARALIQSRLAALDRFEDVPSPTFTLVQCYDLDSVELWHADLYRLTSPSECDELGLVDAFESAICLVEWPDRLGDLTPQGALLLDIRPEGDDRHLHFQSEAPRWRDRLMRLGAA
ncbi:tRNA (adenosine(37)-N6)-threonylcarbamoyltransferase complex ATPase subunit type 1 TsaE [Roseinatronobacter domitianus]|nr:tRNA (adenosine(37)-N6)-threonylcarbamoyltransferase complex ATPase subunit type 1 TsaE [Roseibaca domitiana]